jgi:hypothetical protein
MTPCRVVDTRPNSGLTGAFGQPGLIWWRHADLPNSIQHRVLDSCERRGVFVQRDGRPAWISGLHHDVADRAGQAIRLDSE